MFIEVLIVLNRNKFFPELIPQRLINKRYPYSRIGEIVDILKNNTQLIRSEDYRESEKQQYSARFYKFSGQDYSYFTFNPIESENTTYAIENVDISRPWTIQNSDNGEYIKYFSKTDRFIYIDKELNYGEYV